MSQITLFTDSRVPCPQRLLLTIHELGLQIKDTREVDISKFEHKVWHRIATIRVRTITSFTDTFQRPEILELNPFGAVPFIRDETYDPPLMLTESRAIARYLAQAYGSGDVSASLLPDPTNVVAIAKFEEAASIELTSFDACANQLVFEELFKPYVLSEHPHYQFNRRIISSFFTNIFSVIGRGLTVRLMLKNARSFERALCESLTCWTRDLRTNNSWQET